MPSTWQLGAAHAQLRLIRMMLAEDTYLFPHMLDGLVIAQPTDDEIAAGRAKNLARARRRVERRRAERQRRAST